MVKSAKNGLNIFWSLSNSWTLKLMVFSIWGKTFVEFSHTSCIWHLLVTFFISPFSLLTGGLQTPPNPETVEKVRFVFLLFLLLSTSWIQLHEGVQWKLITSLLVHQCGGGWRCTHAVAVSLGTLWWKFGGSYQEKPTTSLSRPVSQWEGVVAAVLTRPWSVCPRSHTRLLWRYTHRHRDTLNSQKWEDVWCFILIRSQLMRTSFMKHELIELPFVEHSQCECR